MRQYLNSVASVSPTFGAADRAYDVVSALIPPTPKAGSVVTPTTESKPSFTKSLVHFVPSAVGLAAGYLFTPYKKHRVLSALAGHAIVYSGYTFYKGDKKRALCEAAVEGAGILGALKFKRSPVLGWVGGILAGSVVTSFVDGSPARDEFNWLKRKLGG